MEEISVKEDLDDIIQYEVDKVVCIRFGSSTDAQTIQLDETVRLNDRIACFIFDSAWLDSNNTYDGQKINRFKNLQFPCLKWLPSSVLSLKICQNM